MDSLGREELKRAVLDWSFSRRSFPALRAAAQDDESRRRRHDSVPKLRFCQIRSLKLCILSAASLQGELSVSMLTSLFASTDFIGCVFDLMDLDGDDFLDGREMLQRSKEEEDSMKKKFVSAILNDDQSVSKKRFQQLWLENTLQESMAEAALLSSETINMHSLMKFIILFTNPK